jgi:hypothetical protein
MGRGITLDLIQVAEWLLTGPKKNQMRDGANPGLMPNLRRCVCEKLTIWILLVTDVEEYVNYIQD